ncbi:MAG: hypothetical protein HDQ87_01735 [Clostridia bacterium]|nr:hypothetical protein [Clostridia bacterium]
MLKISKTYLEQKGDSTRLCADVSIGAREATLWFAVDSIHADWLALGRADGFVMALLPGAMRGKHDIVCEDPMSERLHGQLVRGLIPALTFAGGQYHPIQITAPLTSEKLLNGGAVGTGFSGGADCLYTVMSHGRDSVLPLTHIAVFNNGHMGNGLQAGRNLFRIACEHAQRFALEQSLQMVALDSNIYDTLSDRGLDVYSFRNYACGLVLGQLFSVYLLSSGHDAAHFALDLHNSATFDLLTARCASTESLSFYHAGEEMTRVQKLIELAEWEPSWRWLHPCFRQGPDQPNCGHCKKCIRDMSTLYALKRLDRYRAVYDVDDFVRNLPQRMGVLLAHSDAHLYAEAIELLMERNIPIPPQAYAYERQFRIAMKQLQAQTEEQRSYQGK